MEIATDKQTQLKHLTPTKDESALLRCQLAATFLESGQFELAAQSLGDLWPGIGVRPDLEGLSPICATEVLLKCGVITAWLGSARNVAGAQETAKDLLSEALRSFQELDLVSRQAEAQSEIGLCYWRLGAFDEARVLLTEAAGSVGEEDRDLRAKILIRCTVVEISQGRYHEAWQILRQAQAFFESCNDAIKGRWHGQMALVLDRLGTSEARMDYLDRAIIEYTAAIHHYELAQHERYCGTNLNNLAMVLYRLARYKDAHEHLDRARSILSGLGDTENVAQVDDTRARVLISEGKLSEALQVISGSVQVFERGEENALLADALTVRGTALARLGKHEESLQDFRRAIEVACLVGASESAGQAALALIEEHGEERSTDREIYETYLRADEFLTKTQDLEDIKRLRNCSRIVARRLFGGEPGEPGFSFPESVRNYEARFIEKALDMADGSVTRAAKLLGLSHHSSLAVILKTRHQDLLNRRTPAIPRRRSIIKIRSKRRLGKHEEAKHVGSLNILHIEDNPQVASLVKSTLEEQGWSVETISNGSAGQKAIEGQEHYDLVILDNDLPGLTGLDLIVLARQAPHRNSTPIIMLSADPSAHRALAAGADVCLLKPDGISEVTDAVRKLTARNRNS